MSIIELISIIFAVAGIALSIYFGIENRRLNTKLRSLTWDDVILATKDLAKIIDRKFNPDFIYSSDPRGGIIALLIRDALNKTIPVISGNTLWKEDFGSLPALHGYCTIETTKWFILVPEGLSAFAGKRVLIVDDLAMSGDTIAVLREHISKTCGVSYDYISSCTLIVNETAIKIKKAPNFYWKTVTHHDFFFPWGKAK